MTWITFTTFGLLGGILSSTVIGYILGLISQISNITQRQKSSSELIGLSSSLILLGIFESFNLCYRLFFRGKRFVRIGFINSLIGGVLIALICVYSLTYTNIHTLKNDLVKQGTVRNYNEAELVVKKFLFRETGTRGPSALFIFSVIKHPFLFLAISVSCLISLWTLMPKKAIRAIDLAKGVGVVKKY